MGQRESAQTEKKMRMTVTQKESQINRLNETELETECETARKISK